MLDRLQKKWKVNGPQLALIICTFAIGGSLTGYAARKLMPFLGIHQNWLWILIYIVLITLLWPLAVVLVSIPFGQFPFFIKYIRKIGVRVGVVRSRESGVRSQESGVGSQTRLRTPNSRLQTQIAVFASGTGSNTQKIIDHFRDHASIKVALVVCNDPGAGVLNIAAIENIPFLIIQKEKFFHGNAYVEDLKSAGVDFIILAGFLWKLPSLLLKAFPGKIINIHPALLPKYGGKGMFGQHVHEAVLANKDKESGISIHYVDELYDHGQVIFQISCPVLPTDTAESLAQRVHMLEHEHYPKVIEDVVKSVIKVK